MSEEELREVVIRARICADLDVDAIKLFMYYKERIEKADKIDKKKGDELEKEWQSIYKGFVHKYLLKANLTYEDHDSAIKYLWA